MRYLIVAIRHRKTGGSNSASFGPDTQKLINSQLNPDSYRDTAQKLSTTPQK
uniref:hypothetical protein n=1 Tax=Nonlabens sp. Ci31 TaxID=2608253 RepID=UPI001473481C|nr:hypothetical protein [Nonlabens sp. Ci31]